MGVLRRQTLPLRRTVSVPTWVVIVTLVIIISVVTIQNNRYNMLLLTQETLGALSNPKIESTKTGYLNDKSNVPLPTHLDGTPMSLEERLRYLELKTNAFMNFGSDPFFGSTIKTSTKCKRRSDLLEFGCKDGSECAGLFDHDICLDKLPKPGTSYSHAKPACLVYDFGIREQPQFGEVMARTFGCEVHAFDPSPISVEWWKGESSKALRDLPNYHFHPYGTGGKDGDITLMKYIWEQVSILRYPTHYQDCTKTNKSDTHCELKTNDDQTSFTLPVKTLPTIMKELGHMGRTLDILKIDVEGSEYSFLENMLDSMGGCPDFIGQIALEWHHMNWDPKYGEGSSPSINALATLLYTCGLKLDWHHSPGGWPETEKQFHEMGMNDVRYNVATFRREV